MINNIGKKVKSAETIKIQNIGLIIEKNRENIEELMKIKEKMMSILNYREF